MMREETPIYVAGELIGWKIVYPEEWREAQFVGGGSYRYKVRDRTELFIPVSENLKDGQQ